MKKLFKKTAYFFIFLSFLFTQQQTEAQESCKVEYAQFSAVTGSGFFDENNSTNIKIKSIGCEDGLQLNFYKVQITKADKMQTRPIRVDNIPGTFYPKEETGDIIYPKINVNDGVCYGSLSSNNKKHSNHECITFIEVKQGDQVKFTGNDFISPDNLKANPSLLRDNGVLLGNCSGLICGNDDTTSNDAENWKFLKEFNTNVNSSSDCKIEASDVNFTQIPEEITNKKVSLKLSLENKKCFGVNLRLILENHSEEFSGSLIQKGDITYTTNKDYIDFTPDKNANVVFNFKAHDDDCYSNYGEYDCNISTKILDSNGSQIYSSQEYLKKIIEDTKNLSSSDETSYVNKYSHKQGVLLKECDGYVSCSASGNDWKIIDIKGANSEHQSQASHETLINTVDADSPCYKNGEIDENCYEFLAPIPGIDIDADGNKDNLFKTLNYDKDGNLIPVSDTTTPVAEQRTAITNIREYQIGNYINKLFQIAIAILAVISVVMIIIAGVQYMTVESIYGKSDARSRITNAVLGLILSLSIYLIIGTINPEMLDVNFGKDIAGVKIEAADGGVEPTGIPEYGVSPNKQCSKFTTINQPDGVNITKFDVCDPVKDDIEKLLEKAKSDGIILTAYGARSTTKQIALRKKNCGSSHFDIYEKPSGSCKPPTAIPGTSKHESGYALDFQCVKDGQVGAVNIHKGNKNGTKKEWTISCWNWLAKNASSFGFKNIKSENWHWEYVK